MSTEVQKKTGKTWKVKVTIAGAEQPPLELFDACTVFGEYIQIRRNYFDDLIDSLKISKNYSVGKGIEEVIGIDGENWTKNPWILVMAKDNEKGVPFWLLIKRENDLNGFLVAIGPELLYKYMNESKENLDEIRKILEYLVVYHAKWTTTVLIPNFLV